MKNIMLITEKQMGELLSSLGFKIHNEKNAIDSNIVHELAAQYNFTDLGDCGNGSVFQADRRILRDEVLNCLVIFECEFTWLEHTVPAKDQIKDLYEKFIESYGQIVTCEQVKEVENKDDKYGYMPGDITINGNPANEFDVEDNIIEYIRYENYGILDYIYCHVKDGKISWTTFDVWWEGDDYFLNNVTIDNLNQDYSKRVMSLMKGGK
ncbi:hypothetical protein M2146_002571 [Lachnospiraceae bacterium PF1-22]